MKSKIPILSFEVLSIFPEALSSYLNSSVIGRAIKLGLIKVNLHNLRQWAKDRRRTVDDRPYGGGPGMVFLVEPIMKALQKLRPINKKQNSRVILFSAKGKLFSQKDARRLAKYKKLIFICGHYEGVDERVAEYLADEELSIGEYVLTGGELPALVVIDAVARLLPGVLGKKASLAEESFSITGSREYPHYTRPETIKISGKKRSVPKVLLSGDHKKIKVWQFKNMLK